MKHGCNFIRDTRLVGAPRRYAPRPVSRREQPLQARSVDDEKAEQQSQLARSQRARREKILNAVLDLAAEGGYDAVQVREVAKHADVAMRTIYNYYGSREELLRAALVEWRARVAVESAALVKGTTFEERILSLLRHNFEVYEQHPKLFQTFMRAAFEYGLRAPAAQDTMVASTEAILAEVPPAFAADFRAIIGHVIYAALGMAASGMVPIGDVWPQIERTVHRLALSIDR